MPNDTNTWGFQTATIIEKQFGKHLTMKETRPKRSCIPQVPSCNLALWAISTTWLDLQPNWTSQANLTQPWATSSAKSNVATSGLGQPSNQTCVQRLFFVHMWLNLVDHPALSNAVNAFSGSYFRSPFPWCLELVGRWQGCSWRDFSCLGQTQS